MGLCALFCFFQKIRAEEFKVSIPEGTLLVIDILDESQDFPLNFRMSSDSFPVAGVLHYYKDNEHLPSREGLDTLKCSGSAQFSGSSLQNIKRLVRAPLVMINLRLEPQVFLEGHAISWFAPENNFYQAKYNPEWHLVESSLISSLKKNSQTKVHMIIDKINKRIIESSSFYLEHQKVSNEKELLSHDCDLSYVRLPVLDSHLPEDEVVDLFLDTISHLPQDTWVHFHCRAGKGRTTLFMIMYDIIRNGEKVPLKDIIDRQFLLSPSNFKIYPKERQERIMSFLKEFYAFSNDSKGLGKMKWSEWIQSKKNYLMADQHL